MMYSTARARRESQHGFKYTEFPGENCLYCGEPATSQEHVPSLAEAERSCPTLGDFVIIPACLSCNMIVGQRGGFTVEERQSYIKQRLEKKWRKIAQEKMWTEEEYNELGPELRSYIAAALDSNIKLRRRLDYIKTFNWKKLFRNSERAYEQAAKAQEESYAND